MCCRTGTCDTTLECEVIDAGTRVDAGLPVADEVLDALPNPSQVDTDGDAQGDASDLCDIVISEPAAQGQWVLQFHAGTSGTHEP